MGTCCRGAGTVRRALRCGRTALTSLSYSRTPAHPPLSIRALLEITPPTCCPQRTAQIRTRDTRVFMLIHACHDACLPSHMHRSSGDFGPPLKSGIYVLLPILSAVVLHQLNARLPPHGQGTAALCCVG